MIIAMLIVGYILSVVASWFGGRYLERDNQRYNAQPMPFFLAVLFTFVPILNALVAVIGLFMFLVNKFNKYDSIKFYRLKK